MAPLEDAAKKSSTPTSEQEEEEAEESSEWTTLYAMKSAGMEFDESWDFDEEKKMFTFTLTIEPCVEIESSALTFAASSPEQEGEVGTDYIPSCCEVVAKQAVKWFSELHDLLYKFNLRKTASIFYLHVFNITILTFLYSLLGWRSFVLVVSFLDD